MATNEQQAIKLIGNDETHRLGTLNITVYNKNDRVKRALAILGLFWLLAALSIPIVIVHWLLVPGFLIAGPIMAYRRYLSTATTENAAGQCPHCKQDVMIELDSTDTLPKWTYCPACNKPIQLVK
jgi:hypothetical protein